MTQISYVLLAYGLSVPVLAGLVALSYAAMRKAERAADALGRRD
ncbi:MAG: heme exporter protein CcmD [Sphingomonadales bacterium]|jgi:heme exporter protein CcmD|nr:heme exporter protein CcmD [Sphingomonadales bacterium]